MAHLHLLKPRFCFENISVAVIYDHGTVPFVTWSVLPGPCLVENNRAYK